jgi:hypothetical protein
MLYIGLRIILDDLNEDYEFCSSATLRNYQYALVSLTSTMDVENLINTLEHVDKGNCKVVVGGSGCVNIRAYSDLIDIAVFGRAEGQINDILSGKELPNVWRKDVDPKIESIYHVRQSDEPTKSEMTIGCPNKCYFCQYSWTRKATAKRYTHGGDLKIDEDDFRNLQITKSGRYTTAFDGLSERTRFAVNKTWITKGDIRNKFDGIYENEEIKKPINMKIFNIVGYPWETRETVSIDFVENGKLWKEIDRNSGEKRIVLMYYFTPFSPEPLTPMQYSKSNPMINWHTEIGHGKCVCIWGGKDINAFTLPQINSGITLAKRVLINRCRESDRNGVRAVLQNRKIRTMSASLAMHAVATSGVIDCSLFGEIEPGFAGFDYLRTYCNTKKMHGIAEKRYSNGV